MKMEDLCARERRRKPEGRRMNLGFLISRATLARILNETPSRWRQAAGSVETKRQGGGDGVRGQDSPFADIENRSLFSPRQFVQEDAVLNAPTLALRISVASNFGSKGRRGEGPGRAECRGGRLSRPLAPRC
ncbi:hypothetical protein SKAU_G00317320 [Synaphobranchus kaupii]|uniref:Uncharacterized protein n=1 Tax=Synaphobranchus kaupii TaxID=118154 RepID=A0A9Q1ET29_SYNKA|nr:hypothetical protein SKAU_G00317320 [Synaphobranchus kaupii]